MKIRSITLSLLLAFSGVSLVAMQGPTYYDILGVASGATNDEIKEAYKKLSLRYHPDRHAGESDADIAEATRHFKLINDANTTLRDFHERQKYDQFVSGNQQPAAGGAHFAGNGNAQDDAYEHVMLLAGIASARKTYSYLTRAWDQHTMHNNFVAIKKHIALQVKNKAENKPVARLCDSLDLTWLTRLRQQGKPSSIEQAIEQFDRLAVQNPQSLPTIGTQVVKIVDMYSNAVGTGRTSLFKAAAIVGASALGYLTSDKWLPQVLNSKLFYIAFRLFS